MGKQIRIIISIVFIMVGAGALIRPVLGQSNCPNGENYDPCRCVHIDVVECDGVLMENASRVFNRTTPIRLITLLVYLSVQDASKESIINIPNNLLNEHYVDREIWLRSPNNSYSLHIAPGAFLSSRNFTHSFYFQRWNTSGLDFVFLTHFHKLCCLQFDFVSNVYLANWPSLPLLPNLQSLIITGSTGLNLWETFPSLTRGLDYLYLPSNDIESVAMDRILNWTIGHSANTMQKLQLQENDLTRIPKQISAFTSLYDVDIGNQKNGIPTIHSGSIKFPDTTAFILYSAMNNKIEKIEPGAFKGNFKSAVLKLSNNSLTRVDELVFKEILQEMANASSGGLHADGNPFDCGPEPCHLAWLLRDNPHLLYHFIAFCSNGAPFHFLVNSSAFNRCDEIAATKPPRNGSERSNSYHKVPKMAVTLMLTLLQIKNEFL